MSCRSLAVARSLLLSDPQAGGAIAMCAVFVSSFSRHPLAIDDEAAIIHLSAMRCDLPEAATITAMTAIAAAAVAMMARGGWRERDE